MSRICNPVTIKKLRICREFRSEWLASPAGKYASSTVGTIAFGALSGGIGAELSGGNFWQGAVTGGIVAGLNHAMHKMERPFGEGDKEKALRLAKEHEINSQIILAKTQVIALLLECTTVGEFTLTPLREKLIQIYGDLGPNPITTLISLMW